MYRFPRLLTVKHDGVGHIVGLTVASVDRVLTGVQGLDSVSASFNQFLKPHSADGRPGDQEGFSALSKFQDSFLSLTLESTLISVHRCNT